MLNMLKGERLDLDTHVPQDSLTELPREHFKRLDLSLNLILKQKNQCHIKENKITCIKQSDWVSHAGNSSVMD